MKNVLVDQELNLRDVVYIKEKVDKMQKLSISDDLWVDILSGKKSRLYYKGKLDFILSSSLLETNSGKDKKVIRVVKVDYREDRDITVVDFEL